MTARTGDEMSGPALLIAGLAVTGSPVVASWLLAGLTVSSAVGGIVLGAVLDRVRRPGRALAWCLGGYAVGLGVILAGLGRVPAAVLVGVAVVAGLLGPALTGGWTAQVPQVAPGARLARANALDSMSYNLAGLAGPALAGLAATAVGAYGAVGISVGLVLLAVLPAWTLPVNPRPRAAAVRVRDLTEGVRAILVSRALLRTTVASMVSFAGMAMLVVSAPVLGIRFGAGAGFGGLLLAVVALFALAANGLLAGPLRRLAGRPDAVLVGSTLVLGLGLAITAVAGATAAVTTAAGAGSVGGGWWGVGWAVVGVVVVGVASGPQLTAVMAVRHREAPEQARGQVFTTGASLKITSFAVGSAVAGPLVAWSPPWALVTGAVLQVVAIAAFWLLSPGGPSRNTAEAVERAGRMG
ncbi:MFS transporter [Nonomuraea sediminis]|uniref:MFS transporter n=1 Tax=Nonomuraea sediminis TaxID=2835864 RepID=UPI001BDD508B|nr:MFS transporter [Nonomuraea sediminis]